MSDLGEVNLDIAGLGIIMYSPQAANHIAEDEDYLTAHYSSAIDVQEHIQAGSIVGFGTGSPGSFRLRVHEGEPDDSLLRAAQYKLRLGLTCQERVVFRDLYDLMEWTSSFDDENSIELQDGIYRLTLMSDTPSSGRLGDQQVIDIFFSRIATVPRPYEVGNTVALLTGARSLPK